MSTAAPTARSPVRAPGAGLGESWTGTGALLRLYLRLDRVRVVVWALAIAVVVAGSLVQLEAAFPTAKALQARAALMSNPSAIMMSGPAFGQENYTFEAMVANELSLYLYLAAAIMSILLMIRHTRADEESGRLEILRALPVARFAPAAAALLTVTIANIIAGAVLSLTLLSSGMPVAGSVALGLATALTGLLFAAVAAVMAQVSAHARVTSGLAMLTLGVAFLVRGAGDILDNQGSWLSWFSPLAWAQQTRLYVDLRWWPLALSAVVTLLLLTLAVLLARRRDLGAGLRRGKPGPETAGSGLLSPAGLATRLLTGSFLTWLLGVFFFAVAFGALANSLEGAIAENPELTEWIATDLEDLTSGFAASMLSLLMLAAVIFSVSAVLRLRSEEQAGRAEMMIVTGSSRRGLLSGWLTVVAVQTVVIVACSGLGLGLGVGVVTGDSGWIGRLTLAALAYLPATFLIAGVAVALYAVLPRMAALAWVLVVWVALVLFLGPVLDLPDVAMDLSPVTHTPLVPNAEPEIPPLLVLSLIAAALIAGSLLAYRHRDLLTRSAPES